MRSQHQRNSSMGQEKCKNNHYTHHRSFSYTRQFIKLSRQHKNNHHIHMNFLSPDHFPTEIFTLPLSTELNKETKHRTKKIDKQYSKLLHNDKQNFKSKEKSSHFLKDRQEKQQCREKKSSERGQKNSKNESKQWAKHKRSSDKVKQYNSIQGKHSKSNEYKKNQIDKPSKIGIAYSKQKKHKKHAEGESININWEQVIKEYGTYLTLEEIAEIKDYKWIYFLGKIKERKFHPLKTLEHPLNSARENGAKEKKVDIYQTISQQYEIGSSRKFQTEDEFYKYEIGDHIAYRYEIIESINQGSFGEVIKVYDHKVKELLALKIAKRSQELVQQTFMEITILTQIREKDKSNLSGVVRIKDFTIFRNHICMVFELLDGNLYELLVANHYNGLSEQLVRIFAVQILNSLSFLQRQKVIHCDIKPENIVMKTWGKSGIKIVDFGTSCFQGKQMYEYLQSRYYRAPEIIFKKRYSFPIDIWSFGCLIAQLKIGEPIFAGATNIQQLLYMVNSLGLPHQEDGTYSKEFLNSSYIKQIISEDYAAKYKQMLASNQDLTKHPMFSQCKYVKTCMKTLKQRICESSGFNRQDISFYNFVMKLLAWEPEKRLKPHEALQDPWITKGLPNQIKQLYTIYNSAEYSKKSKPKSSKDSKNTSKAKSNSKTSKQKGKLKDHSAQRKKQKVPFSGRIRQTIFDSKTYRYSSKVNSHDLMNQ